MTTNQVNEKKDRILFLSRVYPSDFIDIEYALEDKLLEGLPTETENETIIYNNIPKIFYNLDSWIKSTNILCWHCHISFDSVPVFCPKYKYNSTSFEVQGNFCSFPCASKWNDKNSRPNEKSRKTKLLVELYFIFYGDTVMQVPMAPDYVDMIAYGGFLTREQFEDVITLSMSSYRQNIKNNSIASIEVNEIVQNTGLGSNFNN